MKAIIIYAVLLGCIVGCESRRNENVTLEASTWSAYRGTDAVEAFKSFERYHNYLIQSRGKLGEESDSHEVMMAELRLFALAHYLGKTNSATNYYSAYLSNLFQIRKGRGQQPTNVSPKEALLGLELLERNIAVKWKENTNVLVNYPPSKKEVEAYGRLFKAGAEKRN